jgi:hypothetical protein
MLALCGGGRYITSDFPDTPPPAWMHAAERIQQNNQGFRRQ